MNVFESVQVIGGSWEYDDIENIWKLETMSIGGYTFPHLVDAVDASAWALAYPSADPAPWTRNHPMGGTASARIAPPGTFT